MNKRAFKFILALTALTVLIWAVGEILIGLFINNYTVSVIWGILCLVSCCAYSVWKCPWNIDGDDEEEK